MEKLTEERIAELEEKVVHLQEVLESWRQTGMPEKTLLILLNHYTGIPQRTIKQLMEGFDNLYEAYFVENS